MVTLYTSDYATLQISSLVQAVKNIKNLGIVSYDPTQCTIARYFMRYREIAFS